MKSELRDAELGGKGVRVNFAPELPLQPKNMPAKLHSDPFSRIAGGLPWP